MRKSLALLAAFLAACGMDDIAGNDSSVVDLTLSKVDTEGSVVGAGQTLLADGQTLLTVNVAVEGDFRVAEASVVLEAVGATFTSDATSVNLTTNNRGEASAQLRLGKIPGPLVISAEVTKDSRRATAMMTHVLKVAEIASLSFSTEGTISVGAPHTLKVQAYLDATRRVSANGGTVSLCLDPLDAEQNTVNAALDGAGLTSFTFVPRARTNSPTIDVAVCAGPTCPEPITGAEICTRRPLAVGGRSSTLAGVAVVPASSSAIEGQSVAFEVIGYEDTERSRVARGRQAVTLCVDGPGSARLRGSVVVLGENGTASSALTPTSVAVGDGRLTLHACPPSAACPPEADSTLCGSFDLEVTEARPAIQKIVSSLASQPLQVGVLTQLEIMAFSDAALTRPVSKGHVVRLCALGPSHFSQEVLVLNEEGRGTVGLVATASNSVGFELCPADVGCEAAETRCELRENIPVRDPRPPSVQRIVASWQGADAVAGQAGQLRATAFTDTDYQVPVGMNRALRVCLNSGLAALEAELRLTNASGVADTMVVPQPGATALGLTVCPYEITCNTAGPRCASVSVPVRDPLPPIRRVIVQLADPVLEAGQPTPVTATAYSDDNYRNPVEPGYAVRLCVGGGTANGGVGGELFVTNATGQASASLQATAGVIGGALTVSACPPDLGCGTTDMRCGSVMAPVVAAQSGS